MKYCDFSREQKKIMIVFEIDSASPLVYDYLKMFLATQECQIKWDDDNDDTIKHFLSLNWFEYLSKMAIMPKILFLFFIQLVSAQVQFPLEAGEQSGRMVIVDQR